MTQPTGTTAQNPGTGWAPPGWEPPTDAPPPPPPPGAKKPKLGRWLLAAGLTIVVLAAAGSLTESDDTTSSGGSVASSSRKTSSTSSMVEWAARYGKADSSMLSADLSAMTTATQRFDLDGMASACRTFQRHIATAESHLPTPDPQVTSALRDAYSNYDRAAAACIRGASTLDADDLSESGTYLERGAAALRRATTALRAYN